MWGVGREPDPCRWGAGPAQFFLYLPSQPLSSEQDWVERDILLLISNLPLPLGFPIVTLYPPPPPTPAAQWEQLKSWVVSFVGVSRVGESGVPVLASLASPSWGPWEGPTSGPQFLPSARRDCCSPVAEKCCWFSAASSVTLSASGCQVPGVAASLQGSSVLLWTQRRGPCVAPCSATAGDGAGAGDQGVAGT